MRPVTRVDGKYKFYAECDRRAAAFTWYPTTDEDVPPLVVIGTYESTHEYGAPALFKPSIEEAVAAAPDGMLEDLQPFAFSIAAANDGRPPGVFTEDGSKHRAIVTLYGLAS